MIKQEELLIRKAQRGSLSDFESLVKKYDEKIARLIYNMLNNTEDAEDVYQEVFLKVFQSIHKYRFGSKFYTWLYRIAVNTCINYRKKRSSRSFEMLEEVATTSAANWDLLFKSSEENPEEAMLNLELHEKISSSIENLSPKQRAVFVLRHYHGHKLSEIAEILNCSEGTVKNYLFRSIQKMKAGLKNYRQL